MRKIMSGTFLALTMLLLQAHTLTAPNTSSHCQAAKPPANQAWLTYYWYEDEDFTMYTGYNSTVDAELTRLRALYPSYVFSGSPGIGLNPFEYGLHPFYVPATIYSNM